jgi:hypothetical protein
MAYNGKYGPDVPLVQFGYGLRTPFGVLLPPGGRVAAFVRSTGYQDQDDPAIANNLVTTLAAGLARCRAGLMDTVVVLPGHSESVADATMLDNLVNGCRILGVGHGSLMPTFRWTATGSQWVMDNTDTVIQGLRLRMEGANGVVKAIAITGADNAIYGCDIEVASGATAKATIGIEIGTGAARCQVIGNNFRGTATHNVTDGVLVAAVVANPRIEGNRMVFSATAANGCIRVGAVAATEVSIADNLIANTHTASSAGIAFGAAASTGLVANNFVSVLADANPASGTGITFGAGCLVRAFQNFVADEPVRSGMLAPAVVAT